MSIELSLRQRAKQARCFAMVWLALATVILIGSCISLPFLVGKTMIAVNEISSQSTNGMHFQLLVIGTLVLEIFTISFACFLLGRMAFVEIELAARFVGLADALCLAGNQFDIFEKAVNLLVPKAKYLSMPEIFSAKELNSIAEILKQLQKGQN